METPLEIRSPLRTEGAAGRVLATVEYAHNRWSAEFAPWAAPDGVANVYDADTAKARGVLLLDEVLRGAPRDAGLPWVSLKKVIVHGSPALLGLPWEMMRDPYMRSMTSPDQFVRSKTIGQLREIVRVPYPPILQSIPPMAPTPVIRVLVLVSRAEAATADPNGKWAKAFQDSMAKRIDLRVFVDVLPATWQDMMRCLTVNPSGYYHAVLFDGPSGLYYIDNNDGALPRSAAEMRPCVVFEMPSPPEVEYVRRHVVDAATFASVMCDAKIELVWMIGGRPALPINVGAFSAGDPSGITSVLQCLVQHGIRAAVGCIAHVNREATAIIVDTMTKMVFEQHMTISSAVRHVRIALANNAAHVGGATMETWALPRLYQSHSGDGVLAPRPLTMSEEKDPAYINWMQTVSMCRLPPPTYTKDDIMRLKVEGNIPQGDLADILRCVRSHTQLVTLGQGLPGKTWSVRPAHLMRAGMSPTEVVDFWIADRGDNATIGELHGVLRTHFFAAMEMLDQWIEKKTRK